MRGRATALWLALLGGGCGDTAEGATSPRCVATGIADGSWLTADWDESVSAPNCASVPAELRDPATPGRYVEGDGAIGEIRCEGLRPGAATLRVRMRVRMLTANGADERACYCANRWVVTTRVLIDGAPTRSLDGLTGGDDDPSCVRGPDLAQSIGVTVGEDGRVRARVELSRCERSTPTACVFLRGTGMSVEQ